MDDPRTITVNIENVPAVRAALGRERLAARASLAALLLITDPRASQHVVAARPRIRAGYLLVADELLDAYDFAPLPEAKPGQTPGLIYTDIPETEDGAGYTAVSGEAGPPGFVAALHDALTRAAMKGLANVVVLTHTELSAEPGWTGQQLADARTHAVNLAAQVMISARAAASDAPGRVARRSRSCEPVRQARDLEDATRRSIASFVRAGAHWLRSGDSSEALKALVGCTATAFETLARQIEMGDDKVGLVDRLEVENAAETKRRFFQSIVDSDATRDVTHALAQLDALRNTAIPCARIREEMLAPARRLLGDMLRGAAE